MQKLIILDRDGVINHDLGTYVTCPEEFIFIDGAIAAIARLKRAGFRLAIATNQAGIARGFYSHTDLAAIHAKMLSEIRAGGGDIDRIVYCSSYDNNHPWRKPNAGMLTELLAGFKIDAKNAAQQVVFIGDAVRDMQAGKTIGCRLVMVTDSGKNAAPALPAALQPLVQLTQNLSTATRHLLAEENRLCY